MLTVSGPAGAVARFRAAARGTNAVPWHLDLDHEEARLLAPMLAAGPEARALARQLREIIAARHDRVLARWHERGACPLDLHRLVPIPARILTLGEDAPEAIAWRWTHWGTQELRQVRLVEANADRRRRRATKVVFEFWSADWTPWQALRRIRQDWPALLFAVTPRYEDRGPAAAGGLAAAGAPAAAPPGDDPLWDDGEIPPRGPGTPELHLDGFDGPMDLLLDLAERERIDLSRLSITVLIDQFAAALLRAKTQVPIERRADWLILAARLLALRSRLLFAADPVAAHEAEQAAAGALAWLRERQFVRAAADWLEARPQLGRDVFARPARDRDPRVASYMTLMEACLTLLEREAAAASNQAEAEAVYRPSVAVPHRIPDALARIRARLATLTEPAPLRSFLPRLPADAPDRQLLARSAVSSTLVATLELGRTGELGLAGGERFEAAWVEPGDSGA